MPNTSLPTNIAAGASGHIPHTQTVHTEINRMTRDTGEVDITSALQNGWTSDKVTYRRVDDRVTITFHGLSGADATSTTVLSAGSGSMPSGGYPDSGNLPMNSQLFLNAMDRADPAFFTFVGGGPSLQCRLASNGAASGVVSLGSSTVQLSYTTYRGWSGLPTS